MLIAGALLLVGTAAAAMPEAADSVRLARAKDLISEDQWLAAIPELRAAIADPREPNKDEALFWLAHSQNQAGDLAEAVESIRRLQREFPRSRWSEPAYSLLIELAQKLGRRDVLWRMAPPPHPPRPPAPAQVPHPANPTPAASRPARAAPRAPLATPPPVPDAPAPAVPPAPPAPPQPSPAAPWVAESYLPGADLRVQALGRLIHTDPAKVIPMLRSIALASENPAAARRAVFVLAQSRNREAQMTVVDVARRGPEAVRLTAVRELARFGGDRVAEELLEVYSTGNVPVKQQIVVSLGERSDVRALLKIARSERDRHLRDTAILTLGRAGARESLRELYWSTSGKARQAVVAGLFNAGDEDGLIRIYEQENDPALKAEALARLRLMGTPKTKAYLQSVR